MAWDNTGVTVKISKQDSSSILFAKSGSTTVRQVQVVTVSEIRGLSESGGTVKVPSTANAFNGDDNTTSTTYWASIGGRTYSITVISGNKEEWSAVRRDDSGQWCATKTETSYFPHGLSLSVWGTTELDENGNAVTLSSSPDPIVVSIDKASSVVRTHANASLVSICTTTVSEYRRVSTQSAANGIVNSHTHTATQTSYHTPYTSFVNGQEYANAWAGAVVQSGYDEFASARFVSSAEGWTVTVTKKEYSASSSPAGVWTT